MYRKVIRYRFCRKIPLRVGDKLTNRHGHKSVVGLILPDNAMPSWQDEPLEALIDPISVLNRSNWGQMYELLAGAVAHARKEDRSMQASKFTPDKWKEEFGKAFPDADRTGRSPVAFPQIGWLKWRPEDAQKCAMAGVQFVMRMPQHAADIISTSIGSRKPFQAKKRKVKLSLQSIFALWAHGFGHDRTMRGFTEGACELERVLRLAGIKMVLVDSDRKPTSDLTAGYLRLQRYALDRKPPPGEPFEPLSGGQVPAMEKQLHDLKSDVFYHLEFYPPLKIDPTNKKLPWKKIRCFPVIPLFSSSKFGLRRSNDARY